MTPQRIERIMRMVIPLYSFATRILDGSEVTAAKVLHKGRHLVC